MPHMQQIEASIRQDDLLAVCAPALRQFAKMLTPHDLFGVTHFLGWGLLTACSSSSCETVAVPRFITTMPPAKFASRAADSVSAPAASAAVNVAMTVSPAPVTSVTSLAP